MKQYYYQKDKTKVLVDGDELIQFARDLGYDGDSYGIFYTSGSAKYLRERGYEVGRNEPEVKVKE
ncbi:hypothetical protein M0R04_12570 [Candidatus Dojkabacteria bacterium]|jgi:hypothetical protein|nr:hypothetical protein [Candidatus Dojkabacteria bacterium]